MSDDRYHELEQKYLAARQRLDSLSESPPGQSDEYHQARRDLFDALDALNDYSKQRSILNERTRGSSEHSSYHPTL